MIYFLCLALMMIDMVVAWCQQKKKDICGVVFWCTSALIMAIVMAMNL